MVLKTAEVMLTLEDGSSQLFKLKELSWYESSILTDGWSTLKYQELCITEPVMTPDVWKKISRTEGRKLFSAIELLNRKADDPKKE